jgi:wyosine [tRNA(Phe)-imidazoG37] synthetase (radical SAM superfamily)
VDCPDKGSSTFLWYPHTTLHSTISKKVKIFISKAVGISSLQEHIKLEAFLMQCSAECAFCELLQHAEIKSAKLNLF